MDNKFVSYFVNDYRPKVDNAIKHKPENHSIFHKLANTKNDYEFLKMYKENIQNTEDEDLAQIENNLRQYFNVEATIIDLCNIINLMSILMRNSTNQYFKKAEAINITCDMIINYANSLRMYMMEDGQMLTLLIFCLHRKKTRQGFKECLGHKKRPNTVNRWYNILKNKLSDQQEKPTSIEYFDYFFNNPTKLKKDTSTQDTLNQNMIIQTPRKQIENFLTKIIKFDQELKRKNQHGKHNTAVIGAKNPEENQVHKKRNTEVIAVKNPKDNQDGLDSLDNQDSSNIVTVKNNSLNRKSKEINLM